MAESMSKSASPQKQRKHGKRSARACDECRWRKSKCDGLQPCEACRSTDRYCTFNFSAARSTESGTRIRVLEDRLRRARAYLNEAKKRSPAISDVNFDALLGAVGGLPASVDQGVSNEKDDQKELESMMDSYGILDLNASEGDFYGAASGLAWIQKTGRHFDDDDEDNASSTTPRSVDYPDVEGAAAVQLFDAPLPSPQTLPSDPAIPRLLLPPRGTVTRLVRVVFTQIYPMFHFIREKDFHESTDRIYNNIPADYEESDQSFLPLLYLVMALGYLFSRHEHSQLGCGASVGEAVRYFMAARKMIDIAHLRTVVSLQAIISMILYLISTARMASAHAFLGAACAAAMRQGLHFRSTHDAEFPEKERKVRRRVFWAVMNLDMYITSILGLPPFLDMSAVDPAIDLTIEAALHEGRVKRDLSSPGGITLMASAKHIELMRIVFRAQRTLFPKPLDPPDARSRDGKISVSLRNMQAVETQFREWAESLTEILTYPDDSIGTQSAKYEMHICFCFARIVLYRVFLHYLTEPQLDQSANRHERGYATTCIVVAKKVIKISVEHQRKGLLCPTSWPSVYTIFISIVCLIFTHATREEHTEDEGTRKDIEDGLRLLASTACTTDTGSIRCLEVLRRLLSRVSHRTKIEFDEIYASTRLACVIDPASQGQEHTSIDLDKSHTTKASTPGASQILSVPLSLSSIEPDGRQWWVSPDITMTQPSCSQTQCIHQPPEQQLLRTADDQMVDVLHGGIFDWHGPDNNDVSVFDRKQPTSHQRTLRQQRDIPLRGDVQLTAEDILAFIHSSPLDKHLSGKGQ